MGLDRIGIIVNDGKPQSFSAIRDHLASFTSAGVRFAIPSGSRFRSSSVRRLTREAFLRFSQVVLSFGGDGTLLAVARFIGKRQVPVAGINTGGLGFLTGVGLEQAGTAISQLRAGRFDIEERMMLRVAVKRERRVLRTFSALNDVVINRGAISRLMHIIVDSGTDRVNRYSADGLILSTPTGSTGYSLSAGGPIVSPGLETILLNPICPHSLAERPMLLPATRTVRLKIEEEDRRAGVRLTVDGQEEYPLTSRDTVFVSRERFAARIVVFPGHSFYSVLRNKLNWGIRKCQ